MSYLVETRRLSVPVDDLGITIKRNVPVYITEAQKQGSICLKQLARLGAVTVTPKQRSRVVKAPVAPPKRKKATHQARPEVSFTIAPRPVAAPQPPVTEPPPAPAPPAPEPTAEDLLEELAGLTEDFLEKATLPPPPPESAKKFECPECGRKFTTERGLKIHMRTHKTDGEVGEPPAE